MMIEQTLKLVDFAPSISGSIAATAVVSATGLIVKRYFLPDRPINTLNCIRDQSKIYINEYCKGFLSNSSITAIGGLSHDLRSHLKKCLRRYNPKRYTRTNIGAICERILSQALNTTWDRTTNQFGSTARLDLNNLFHRKQFGKVLLDELLERVEVLLRSEMGDSPRDFKSCVVAGKVLDFREILIDDTRPVLEYRVKRCRDAVACDPTQLGRQKDMLYQSFLEQYDRVPWLDHEIAKSLAGSASAQVANECLYLCSHSETRSWPWELAFEVIAYPVRDAVLTTLEDRLARTG